MKDWRNAYIFNFGGSSEAFLKKPKVLGLDLARKASALFKDWRVIMGSNLVLLCLVCGSLVSSLSPKAPKISKGGFKVCFAGWNNTLKLYWRNISLFQFWPPVGFRSARYFLVRDAKVALTSRNKDWLAFFWRHLGEISSLSALEKIFWFKKAHHVTN